MSADVRSAQELLPWALPITDGLVVCKDSSFLATFEFYGADSDTVGENEVFQIGKAADRLMLALRDLPVSLWWTVRRELTDDYPAEEMPDQISQLLDDENREHFHRSANLANRHFLSIIWMPERTTASMFRKIGMQVADGMGVLNAVWTAIASTYLGRESFAWKISELDGAINEFETKLAQVEGTLSSLKMRRIVGHEFMGFLWAMANPGRKMTPKAWNGRSFLDGYLPERPMIVNRDTLEFGDVEGDTTYATVTSMKDWPNPLAFGAFDTLTSMGCEMVISHCFRAMDTKAAHKHINSVKVINGFLKYPLKTWVIGTLFRKGAMNEDNADPSRAEALAEATEALGALNSGDVIFGYHALNIMLIGQNEQFVLDKTMEMARMFNSSPFMGGVRESIHLVSGWATTLPGQWQEGRRWLPLSSKDAVDIAPLLGVSSGERMNAHLTDQLGMPCQALTVLPTDYNTPFYFNFHYGAVGHTLVVGPTRTGKSIGMNFLISQFRKYGPAANIVIFDKDYSCRIPTLLQGGQHADLRPDAEMKINPIAMVQFEECIPWVSSWVEGLIASRGHYVTSEDAKAISIAVHGTAAMKEPHLRRLMTVRTLLPKHLQIHLDEWVGNGQFARYFDNVEDSFDVSGFTCLEMGQIMKNPSAARAFMEYAFFRIRRMLEAQLTGDMRITMVYVEECWFLLEDETFRKRLLDWLKTLGKLNAFVVLTTQSVEDFEQLPPQIFAAIRDNIKTMIFLPNPQILGETATKFYRKNLDLRSDLIERIGNGTPKQDYIVVQPEVARKVRILLSEVQVAALRSDAPAQRMFNQFYESRKPGWEMEYINAMVNRNKKNSTEHEYA